MTDSTCPPVTVSRQIDAPAARIFAFLADPTQHPVFDGSGMVVGSQPPDKISAVGDVFGMKMHNPEMGDYEMLNYVVEFEPDRRILWEPSLSASDRAEDRQGLGQRLGHRWGFELTPVGADSTTVTEIFDCGTCPDWLREATDNGRNWIEAMTTSLERLEKLSQG
jgi:uncharacterized protein YndB with AHSA1/START domain